MVGPENFATIVLPAITEFALPRSLAQKILQIGQKLLVFDPAQGQWALNQPAATHFALVLLDNDAAAAALWLSQLQNDYNAYVNDAVEQGEHLAFIP